eukprot:Em0001g3025a
MAEEEDMDTSGDPVSAGTATVVERVVRMSLRPPPRFGAVKFRVHAYDASAMLSSQTIQHEPWDTQQTTSATIRLLATSQRECEDHVLDVALRAMP